MNASISSVGHPLFVTAGAGALVTPQIHGRSYTPGQIRLRDSRKEIGDQQREQAE